MQTRAVRVVIALECVAAVIKLLMSKM